MPHAGSPEPGKIEAGAGVVLLTAEEALSSASREELTAAPGAAAAVVGPAGHRSSDLERSRHAPGPGDAPLSRHADQLRTPGPVSTLVSAVRIALQARRRQYEVRDLLQRLEAASRQKDEFLAMLAHELRNPLAPISNAIQLLRMRRGSPTPTVLRVRDVIERQVRAMAAWWMTCWTSPSLHGARSSCDHPSRSPLSGPADGGRLS